MELRRHRVVKRERFQWKFEANEVLYVHKHIVLREDLCFTHCVAKPLGVVGARKTRLIEIHGLYSKSDGGLTSTSNLWWISLLYIQWDDVIALSSTLQSTIVLMQGWWEWPSPDSVAPRSTCTSRVFFLLLKKINLYFIILCKLSVILCWETAAEIRLVTERSNFTLVQWKTFGTYTN